MCTSVHVDYTVDRYRLKHVVHYIYFIVVEISVPSVIHICVHALQECVLIFNPSVHTYQVHQEVHIHIHVLCNKCMHIPSYRPNSIWGTLMYHAALALINKRHCLELFVVSTLTISINTIERIFTQRTIQTSRSLHW